MFLKNTSLNLIPFVFLFSTTTLHSSKGLAVTLFSISFQFVQLTQTTILCKHWNYMKSDYNVCLYLLTIRNEFFDKLCHKLICAIYISSQLLLHLLLCYTTITTWLRLLSLPCANGSEEQGDLSCKNHLSPVVFVHAVSKLSVQACVLCILLF